MAERGGKSKRASIFEQKGRENQNDVQKLLQKGLKLLPAIPAIQPVFLLLRNVLPKLREMRQRHCPPEEVRSPLRLPPLGTIQQSPEQEIFS